MKFETPALILGQSISGEAISFLAEPGEDYDKNEIFSYFSPSCQSLEVIPLANFTSAADRLMVVNHLLDIIDKEDTLEQFEHKYEIAKSLH